MPKRNVEFTSPPMVRWRAIAAEAKTNDAQGLHIVVHGHERRREEHDLPLAGAEIAPVRRPGGGAGWRRGAHAFVERPGIQQGGSRRECPPHRLDRKSVV